MPTLASLCRLLTAPVAEHQPVAIEGAQAIDRATFVRHVARLTTRLGARPPGRWLVFTESAYAFAVALMAVWQSRGIAVLAPNGQPGTLAELSDGTHGLISDLARVVAGRDTLAAVQETGAATWTPAALQPAMVCMELFTSGSSGAQKAVPKTIANLDDEVAGLEQHWGQLLDGRQVLGTVSHQHIYGLLFRVLWPLSAGRTLRAQSLLHAEEIIAAVEGAGPSVLVGSPAHLSRLKGHHDLSRLAPHCRPIFSSGGPLDPSTAAALRESLGAAPFEIFGSTETGGVAWRQQRGDADSLAWRPFAGVAAESDGSTGLLRVRSSFVSHESGAFTIADRVDFLADGRFVLGPRADRIVKLGDKRLSLPDMEAALSAHSFVSQAALVLITRGTGTRLAAAVVLTAAGREALAREGRRSVSQTLVRCLQPYWDPILLPRAWRYLTRLPEDAQGKVTPAGVQAVFASPYDPAVVTAEVLEDTRAGTSARRRLRVPETLGYLDGHFSELPVVPGVAQIQWVMELAQSLLGREVIVTRLEALKFKHVLRPGDAFDLRIDLGPADRLEFRLWNERAVFASGRCVLAPTASGAP